MAEHIGEMVVLPAPPRRHILQQRLLAEIELHDLRHETVDSLVVSDAGTDRIRERYIAGLIGGHQARHAKRAVGIEREGIEKIVVDAPIYHVDLARPLGRTHVHDLVLYE